MEKEYKLICHSCLRFNFSNKIIYTDPFGIEDNYNDADIIFITHNHYDHFSEEDIEKVKKEGTKIVIPEDTYKKAIDIGFKEENIVLVKPNNKYLVDNTNFEVIPAYNTNKAFHPKENGWVGYIIENNNIRYYIAGDTDITEENRNVKCDIAFVPVGGTYTMTAEEAAKLINEIKPKMAMPIHYGKIVGTEQDAERFRSLVDSNIKCL